MSDTVASSILTPDPPRPPIIGARPWWMPDTKGFLAMAIVFLITFLLCMLLLKPINLDERTSQLIAGIIGMLVSKFNDVYAHFFNSTQASQDKDRTIETLGAAAATSVPVSALPPAGSRP